MIELFKNVFWYITREVCIKAVWEDPHMLRYVPDQYKTQEMCIKAVRQKPLSLQYVPDWSVTQKQVKIWRDDDDYCNNDELIK